MRTLLGLAFIALGIFLEVLWLGFCFGSIIIGILLLIFAPAILFFPFNFFLVIGLSIINPQKYSQANRYKYHNNSTNQATNDLDKYYKVLESKESDPWDVIKANYRRLIKEYHYDSIASKDLPEEMLKFAEQKTQALNEAYAAVKKHRK
ncbi:MAG: molecular chaperone DnaJ [Helicobacteraceae bacterium]|nr:molecular chaperone DnaJ [Helicobacteraceae bacterium]